MQVNYPLDPPSTTIWELWTSGSIVRCELVERPSIVEVRCLTPGEKPSYQRFWGSRESAVRDAEDQRRAMLADGAVPVL